MNHMLHDRKHHMHKHSFFQDKLPLLFNEVKSDHMTERARERERERERERQSVCVCVCVCWSATVSV